MKLVNTIMVNTKGEGEKSSEDFWTKAERLLYCALIGYIWYEAPEEEQNFATLLEFINASETREDDGCRDFPATNGGDQLVKLWNLTDICELVTEDSDMIWQSAMVYIVRPVT